MPNNNINHILSSSSQSPSFLKLFTLFFFGVSVVKADFKIASTEYIFSFGDSYSASPSIASDLVNVTATNHTSSGGKMWGEYLASAIPSTPAFYNFADPGATISNSVVNGFGSTDFVEQVIEFVTNFGNKNLSQESNLADVDWKADNSLFTLWFGVEDLGYVYAAGNNWIVAQPYLITTFDQMVSTLYSAGARNFLIMSIPPISYSPLVNSMGSGAVSTIKTATDFYNGRLIVYADLIPTLYPGTTATYFDSSPMFSTIIASPATYGFNDTITTCEAYLPISDDTSLDSSSCEGPLSNYFWKDPYHPSFTVHEYLAQQVYSILATNSTSIPPMVNGSPVAASDVPPAIAIPATSASASKSKATAKSHSPDALLTTSNPTPTVGLNSAVVATAGGSSLTPSLFFTLTFASLVLLFCS